MTPTGEPPINDNSTPVTGVLDGAVFFGAEADEEDAKKEGSEGKTPEVSPDVAKMQGQVDELSKQLEQMRQANMTLMMKPEVKAPAFTMPTPKPEPLPDLMEDPDGYAKALESQITARLEARMTATQAKATADTQAATQYNDLWDDFKASHKDYSDDFKKVQYAANQVAASLSKQGMDVEKYMFTYRTKFMDDVTHEMDSIFGSPEDKRKRAEAEAQEASRTDGMFGGMDTGNKSEAALAPDNAFSDIRKWQEETGFHR